MYADVYTCTRTVQTTDIHTYIHRYIHRYIDIWTKKIENLEILKLRL